MGLRFRKSIKLAPGIRMNFSGSGASWTLGPRGASIGIGRRGTYLNTGIPGTGLYNRERIGAPRRNSSAAGSLMQINVNVDDNGMLLFKDAEGKLIPDALITIAKKQQGEKIKGLIQKKCDELNAQVDALGEIHVHTPPPTGLGFVEEKFYVPRPVLPPLKPLGFWGKVFSFLGDKIEAENAATVVGFKTELAKWEIEKSEFESVQALRRELFSGASAGDETAMGQYLESILNEIVWPRETEIAFEFKGNGVIVLDVDLPEIEDMPKKTASVPQRGMKLSVKEITPTQIQRLYMQHVHAVGFRIIGEVFAALPNIQTIVLSGYSQRANKATGQVSDEYLYSVRVPRKEWAEVNFDNLGQIDVVEAFTRYELRRDMSKTGIFRTIEPLAV